MKSVSRRSLKRQHQHRHADDGESRAANRREQISEFFSPVLPLLMLTVFEVRENRADDSNGEQRNRDQLHCLNG